ncbi:MAG: hypothetical protein H6560_20765 [Lewinellaceae bacterium]|nr:hypothetical protein [Lewinellaceae bacterium]
MKNKDQISVLFLLLLVWSCSVSPKPSQNTWRNDGEADPPSYYGSEESCEKILGILAYQSVEHKGFETEGRFAGIPAANFMEIRADSAFYLNAYNEVKDKGACRCENGKLTVDWADMFGREIEYEIYFKDDTSVELRYLDYKKTLKYYYFGDKSALDGPMDNPAKVIGTLTRIEGLEGEN